MKKLKLDKESIHIFLSELGRKGGLAAAKKLSPRQRRMRARKAIRARWAKNGKKK